MKDFKKLDIRNFTYEFRKLFLSEYVRKYYSKYNTVINILEAGCGKEWVLDLGDLKYFLVGVDVSEKLLKARSIKRGDLNRAVIGDLRSVKLEDSSYDLIYCSFVLEHIEGAEIALTNFVKWLKPGGLIILSIPDRETVFGFLTRFTPFWMHVFVYRFLLGSRNAGKPGYGPYPVYYDKVVSRIGILDFCRSQGLRVISEYGDRPLLKGKFALVLQATAKTLEIISLGRLSATHSGLIYIIQKPVCPDLISEGT